MEETKKYYDTPPYLINGQHRITINLIGCGGTGSMILTRLCRLHNALNHLEHPGFYVKAIDDDIVEEHNVGRQMFTAGDVGQSKSDVLISKINHAFGFDWDREIRKYDKKIDYKANIVISAVDNVKARKEILKGLYQIRSNYRFDDTTKPYFLIDCGNARDFGQVILSDRNRQLKNIIDIYGNDFRKLNTKKIQGEGCSYWDRLQDQDLFINDWASLYAVTIIKDLLFNKRIDYQGFFFNTSDYLTQKMKL